MIDELRHELKLLADPAKAKFAQRFFKTGKGEYGEGDIFLGIRVPVLRKLAAKYKGLDLVDIRKLLKSKIHDERFVALAILVNKFKSSSPSTKKVIYEFYLSNIRHINNWDLVDMSADKIVGEYLSAADSPFETLNKLAESENLWERRVAIIATFAFIKKGECSLTLQIAEKLILDKHDLIQKAVGWMLREVGKRCSVEAEEEFLKKNYKQMGRTCLRYAIEQFSCGRRVAYLKGLV